MSLKMKQTNAITTASRLLLKLFFLLCRENLQLTLSLEMKYACDFEQIAKGELPMERVNTEKVEYT